MIPDDAPQVACPRPEYPRPSFRRSEWRNLNGEWGFEIDQGDSGLERGLLTTALRDRITVPFAPESELSGIGNTDFLEAVWYRRDIQVPEDWRGMDLLLHVGAADYDTTVWVDQFERGRHRGGFTSFTVQLGSADEFIAVPRQVTIRCRDSHRDPQPRGKQTRDFAGWAAHYGRTTGIWQTVWLEPVPKARFERPRITPDVGASVFHLELPMRGRTAGMRVVAELLTDGEVVDRVERSAGSDFTTMLDLTVPEAQRRLWSPQDPHLYDVRLQLIAADGTPVDDVESYAGLRSVAIDGPAVLLNGEPVFQRLVLDQGYYPDSLMTAPSDEALIEDIELSMAAGFNGARLHQKVFEERFLFHADRLGYLVWGEFGDWGCREPGPATADNQRPDAAYITQWIEAVQRDYSHPSIVGWCPLNETYQNRHDRITALDDVTRGMFLATKLADRTRPVIDASGYAHRVDETDIYDSHLYEQDPAKFAALMAPLAEGAPYSNEGGQWSVPYGGQPYFCSEFGGIWWNPNAREGDASWGYGQAVRSEEEVYERFTGLVDALLDDPLMFGYCYTQLTDVFQEQNGIYFFDRSAKLDVARIAAAQRRPAAIESRDG
ncbi:MAG TPA: glycoside hydrolase family 2 TIM barrel-domain containing protein [Flexivirga sp.]|uniref:glycoside hydrolase family 2 protein n=1 Tax=Flexivirga sp. TaxID=1962927 RepID=UPI002B821898|nr:glycoside hydrolase family 2 TIM barrel-domain containing protein [Flexivirga sp.]HWC22515.1 glycoside hydrolase family 2 TIM barrel-domain containing protein [Flexivirga sp.]